ncbi:probable low affinity copper uptake protein 2 [Brienomyrus brachyistius]|uniref:probable low affinity copper uptake protein 2 n=1 Tax=Brienomyrus brachyistius TaxID=42636 RepID=UPI0020B3BA34|nr:probable low affinity copper uptake protein 2 [Brienomyrus brachyistius]
MNMSMHFVDSSSVTLLFKFWDVRGPAGMVLSVFVVLLLTVFYELLKVLKVWLGEQAAPTPSLRHPPEALGSSDALASSPSESSLGSTVQEKPAKKKWLQHSLQTAIHVIHVTLGYMLMLCVMSYNVWIFLGVIAGSIIGYFVAFPLFSRCS